MDQKLLECQQKHSRLQNIQVEVFQKAFKQTKQTIQSTYSMTTGQVPSYRYRITLGLLLSHSQELMNKHNCC